MSRRAHKCSTSYFANGLKTMCSLQMQNCIPHLSIHQNITQCKWENNNDIYLIFICCWMGIIKWKGGRNNNAFLHWHFFSPYKWTVDSNLEHGESSYLSHHPVQSALVQDVKYSCLRALSIFRDYSKSAGCLWIPKDWVEKHSTFDLT